MNDGSVKISLGAVHLSSLERREQNPGCILTGCLGGGFSPGMSVVRFATIIVIIIGVMTASSLLL